MGEGTLAEISIDRNRRCLPSTETLLLLQTDLSDRSDPFEAVVRSSRFEVEVAYSSEELLNEAERSQPDVVLLRSARKLNVVRLVSQLVELTPQPAVMVFFERPNEAELLAIIHAGALGYLPLGISAQRLRPAIETVLKGEPVIPRSMTAAVVRQLGSPGYVSIRTRSDRMVRLSNREWDTLCLLQQGHCTKEIAQRLFVSPATVRSHVAAVVHELDVADRRAALAAVFPS